MARFAKRSALNVVLLCRWREGTPIAGSEGIKSVCWMTPEQIVRDRSLWFKDSKMQRIEEARRLED